MNIPVPYRPSWHDIQIATYKLTKEISELSDIFHVIVAPSRGGLIPGVMMSHITGSRLLPVSYSSKKGNGDGNEHNVLPSKVGVPIANILILDDICDTGNTMKEMVTFYKTAGHQVQTAALYWRETSIMRPDYHHFQLHELDPWVIFPWE